MNGSESGRFISGLTAEQRGAAQERKQQPTAKFDRICFSMHPTNPQTVLHSFPKL